MQDITMKGEKTLHTQIFELINGSGLNPVEASKVLKQCQQHIRYRQELEWIIEDLGLGICFEIDKGLAATPITLKKHNGELPNEEFTFYIYREYNDPIAYGSKEWDKPFFRLSMCVTIEKETTKVKGFGKEIPEDIEVEFIELPIEHDLLSFSTTIDLENLNKNNFGNGLNALLDSIEKAKVFYEKAAEIVKMDVAAVAN